MNLDLDSLGAPAPTTTAQNAGQPASASLNTANTGVFMGATTPGTSGNMM